jgi:protease I
MDNLNAFKVAVLATDGFEQSELSGPVKALKDAGATVHILSPGGKAIQGFQHHDKGERVPADRALEEAAPEEYDGLMLPGGALNADKLRMDPRARHFVRTFDRQRKPIAAICHALWLPISAGVVKDRTLTSYYTIQDDVRNAGGEWVDLEVVRDGHWVTSRQPGDLPVFNRHMIDLFTVSATARTKQPAGSV